MRQQRHDALVVRRHGRQEAAAQPLAAAARPLAGVLACIDRVSAARFAAPLARAQCGATERRITWHHKLRLSRRLTHDAARTPTRARATDVEAATTPAAEGKKQQKQQQQQKNKGGGKQPGQGKEKPTSSAEEIRALRIEKVCARGARGAWRRRRSEVRRRKRREQKKKSKLQ